MLRPFLGLVISFAISQAAFAGARTEVTSEQLRTSYLPKVPVKNSAIYPGDRARLAEAREPFNGFIRMVESRMSVEKTVTVDVTWPFLDPVDVTWPFLDPNIFPSLDLEFYTVGNHLVPRNREIIKSGEIPDGKSYWDILVQPGRIWSEPGDGGWSRAAFPIVLCNMAEGHSQNGLATFLYKNGQVSNLRYQFVQQTLHMYISRMMDAWGQIPLQGSSLGKAATAEEIKHYEDELENRTRIASWSELENRKGKLLSGFFGKGAPQYNVLSGLFHKGTFYTDGSSTKYGKYPFLNEMRFGIQSVTKSMAGAVALLWLAQEFGEDVINEKAAKYLGEPIPPGWEKIRLIDLLNMASGVGHGSTQVNPNKIEDGYGEFKDGFNLADTTTAKLDYAKRDKRYPWGPNKYVRYRDQEPFLLGIAIENFLRSQPGFENARLWPLLMEKVFRPIGVEYFPMMHTSNSDGRSTPMMGYSSFPDIDAIIKVAKLFLNEGRGPDGRQILNPKLASETLASREPIGLPTGSLLPDLNGKMVEGQYHLSFWRVPYANSQGVYYVPHMVGWGGIQVALLPTDDIVLWIKKDPDLEAGGDSVTWDSRPALRVAELVEPFSDKTVSCIRQLGGK